MTVVHAMYIHCWVHKQGQNGYDVCYEGSYHNLRRHNDTGQLNNIPQFSPIFFNFSGAGTEILPWIHIFVTV